jgi:hypothetical protein
MAGIPKIVSQRLHAVERDRIHPDPDLITAFIEKSLAKRERLQFLEHLSRCADCREIVSLSAVPAENAGEALAVVRPGWLSWPVLRWGAAVACVIVVGAAVTLRHKQTLVEEKPAARAQMEAPEIEIAKKVASSVQLADRAAKAAFVTKPAGQPGQAAPTKPAALVAGAIAPPTQSGLRMPAPSGNTFATAAIQPKARAANPGGENYPAATSSAVEMADARSGAVLAEVVPGRAKAASPETQDTKAGKSMGGGALLRKETVEVSAAAASVASDAFNPADVAPRWTLSSDGTLQRSLDSGRTWQTIPVSSKTIFRALAANGLDIWVGGLAGALFHSSDAGQHWTQVRPVANGETLADDIIGVEFTDLLHGKLTTSSAETWITDDAGQTWQKQ